MTKILTSCNKHPIAYMSNIPNCNSSSTHRLIYPSRFGVSIDDDCYGWEFFCLTKRHEKIRYLKIIADHLGINGFEQAFGKVEDLDKWACVDHQSMWYLPTNRTTMKPDYQYVLRLMRYILENDDVSIGGGGDNGDDEPDWYKVHPMQHAIPYTDTMITHRYDKDTYMLYGGYEWRSPEKIYIKFNPEGPDYAHTVDCKITNMCDNGCAWCYQNSCADGAHAPVDRVMSFIDKCHDSGIVEIAFGGGEPTKHPNFQEIITHCKNKRISGNFTTRDFEAAMRVEDARAFALSCDNIEEVAEYMKKAREHNEKSEDWKNINFHLIAWPSVLSGILEFLKQCKDDVLAPYGMTVVLLEPKLSENPGASERMNKEIEEMGGIEKWRYFKKKFIGRLHKVNSFKHGEYENSKMYFAGDIPFFQNYPAATENDSFLEPILSYTDEGRLSFYYDAVEDKTYNCSYGDKYEMNWERGILWKKETR